MNSLTLEQILISLGSPHAKKEFVTTASKDIIGVLALTEIALSLLQSKNETELECATAMIKNNMKEKMKKKSHSEGLHVTSKSKRPTVGNDGNG